MSLCLQRRENDSYFVFGPSGNDSMFSRSPSVKIAVKDTRGRVQESDCHIGEHICRAIRSHGGLLNLLFGHPATYVHASAHVPIKLPHDCS